MHGRSVTIRSRVIRSVVAAAVTSLTGVSAAPASANAVYRVHPRDPAAYRAEKSAARQAYRTFEQQHAAPSADGAVQPEILTSGLNQPGLDANTMSRGVTPPDTTGAIGPDNYVEFVNSEIAVYARASLAAPIGQVDENAFVGTTDDTCDGQIQWDQQGQRWLYAVLDCSASGSNQALFYGWSKTDNPTDLSSAGWCRYEYSTVSSMEDYPKLGHDDSQIIIGTNSFSTTATRSTALAHLHLQQARTRRRELP